MRDPRKTFCPSVCLVAALCALAFGAQPAHAHKLKVFAAAEGADIKGYVYFPGGGRARGVKVLVQGPGEAGLGEVTTDDEGRFSFPARVRCDHTFVADSGDGHRATCAVQAEDLPPDLPAPGGGAGPATASVGRVPEPTPPKQPLQLRRPDPARDSPGTSQTASQRDIEQAVSRQVRPLREALEAYEEKVRLRDVLGGIGYILGIMGITFYFLGRRRRGQNDQIPSPNDQSNAKPQ